MLTCARLILALAFSFVTLFAFLFLLHFFGKLHLFGRLFLPSFDASLPVVFETFFSQGYSQGQVLITVSASKEIVGTLKMTDSL